MIWIGARVDEIWLHLVLACTSVGGGCSVSPGCVCIGRWRLVWDEVYLSNNPLSSDSVNTHMPRLKDRGVIVWS